MCFVLKWFLWFLLVLVKGLFFCTFFAYFLTSEWRSCMSEFSAPQAIYFGFWFNYMQYKKRSNFVHIQTSSGRTLKLELFWDLHSEHTLGGGVAGSGRGPHPNTLAIHMPTLGPEVQTRLWGVVGQRSRVMPDPIWLCCDLAHTWISWYKAEFPLTELFLPCSTPSY